MDVLIALVIQLARLVIRNLTNQLVIKLRYVLIDVQAQVPPGLTRLNNAKVYVNQVNFITRLDYANFVHWDVQHVLIYHHAKHV